MDTTGKLAQEIREDGTRDEILAACYKDVGLYLRTFFPKRFFRPFGPDHRRIFEAYAEKDFSELKNRQVIIVAQRGFGKTTLVRGLACHAITFDEARYILFLGANMPNAERSSEAVKNMMINSPVVKKLFGSLKPENRETDFSKRVWKIRLPEAITGTIGVPKGVEAANRGLNYDEGELSLRPDFIIPDDLDKDEQQNSDISREGLKDNFMAVVKQLVDRGKLDKAPDEIKPWRFIYPGTILGADTLLERLMNREDWTTITAPICDENFKARWPEFADDDDVKRLKEEFKDDMDTFYREFMCLPFDPKLATFKTSYFKYYEELELRKTLGRMVRLLMVDPAKTKKISSADSAIISVAVDPETERIYVLNIVNGKMHPSELYDVIFEEIERWQIQAYGVEVTSLSEFITQPLLEQQLQRGLFPQFIELHARGKKEDRVRQMQPYYKKGQVFHNKDTCGPLETQLVMFPKANYWDVMDAFAYLPQMLAECDIYMKKQEEDVEAQYQKLLDEDEGMGDIELNDPLEEFNYMGGLE